MQQDTQQPQISQKLKDQNLISSKKKDNTKKSSNYNDQHAMMGSDQIHQNSMQPFNHQLFSPSPFGYPHYYPSQAMPQLTYKNSGNLQISQSSSGPSMYPEYPSSYGSLYPTFSPSPPFMQGGGPPPSSFGPMPGKPRENDKKSANNANNKAPNNQLASPFLGGAFKEFTKNKPNDPTQTNASSSANAQANKNKSNEKLVQQINHIISTSKPSKEQVDDKIKVKKEKVEEKQQKNSGKNENAKNEKNLNKPDLQQNDDYDDDEILDQHINGMPFFPNEQFNQYNLFAKPPGEDEMNYYHGISPGMPMPGYMPPPSHPFGDYSQSPMMGYGQPGYMIPSPYPFSPFIGHNQSYPGSVPPPQPGPYGVPHPHEMFGDFGGYYMPTAPYAPMLKVPLPPRKDGEAPSFVFYKQARRILIMRQKKAAKQKFGLNAPTIYFTRLRQKYKSRVNVAKKREREQNGRFKKKNGENDSKSFTNNDESLDELGAINLKGK